MYTQLKTVTQRLCNIYIYIIWSAVHCFSSAHCTQCFVRILCTQESRHLRSPRCFYSTLLIVIFIQSAIYTLHFTATISSDHPWYKHLEFNPDIWRNRVMFWCRSVDFKTIALPSLCARSKVLCLTFVTSWCWMELCRLLLTKTMTGVSANYRLIMDLCMKYPLWFTSYFMIFSWLFYILCYKMD